MIIFALSQSTISKLDSHASFLGMDQRLDVKKNWIPPPWKPLIQHLLYLAAGFEQTILIPADLPVRKHENYIFSNITNQMKITVR